MENSCASVGCGPRCRRESPMRELNPRTVRRKNCVFGALPASLAEQRGTNGLSHGVYEMARTLLEL